MPTNTFTGTANWHGAGSWSLGHNPTDGEDVVINGTCTIAQAVNPDFKSLTINATRSLNMATYTVSVRYTGSTGTHVSGTLTIGAGGTLTTDGIEFLSGSTRDWNPTAIINNYGQYDLSNGGSNADCGILHQKANTSTFISDSGNRNLYEFYLDAGVTITLSGTCYITGLGANRTEINGVVATNGNDFRIGGASTSTVLIGSGGDFSGSGTVTFVSNANGVTFTNNRSTAFSLTGQARTSNHGNQTVPAWDFTNADFEIGCTSTGGSYTKYIKSGTLICQAFTMLAGSGVTVTVDNSAAGGNPSFEFRQNVTFTPAAGTINWTKGSGTITLAGSGAFTRTIDFNGESIESLVVNCGTTQTKSITGAFTTVNLTLTQGTFNVDGHLITGTGAFVGNASGKLITSDTNGIVHASGNLQFSGGYTWNSGFTIECQGTVTMNGTVMPSSSNINYILNGSEKTLTQSANYLMKSLTVTLGTINISTFNCTVSGMTSITGKLTIGASAGTGLTTVGLTFNSGCTCDLQATSKINNSDGYTAPAEAFFANSYRGIYTQTGNGNFTNPTSTNVFNAFTLNVGFMLTCTGTSYITSGAGSTGTTDIQGDLNVNGQICSLGGTAAGGFTFGSAANISGSGTLVLSFISGATISVSTDPVCDFTGTARTTTSNLSDVVFPTLDIRSANVIIYGRSDTASNRYVSAGVLRCNDFTVSHQSNQNIVFDNSQYDPSYTINGNLTITQGSGTITYVIGGGFVAFTGGGAQTVTGVSALESIEMSGAGTVQFASGLTSATSINVITGILDLQAYETNVSGNIVVTGGTLKMSNHAGTGVVCSIFNVSDGTLDLGLTSKINVYGNLTVMNTTFTNGTRGVFIQQASGSVAWETSGRASSYTVSEGVTITSDLGYEFSPTGTDSVSAQILGVLDPYSTMKFSLGTSGSFTFGVNADILNGGGAVYFEIPTAATAAWNKTTALTTTGYVSFYSLSSVFSALKALPINAPSASYQIGAATEVTFTLSAGTLTCRTFIVNQTTEDTLISVNNSASIVCAGEFNLLHQNGSILWTRGVGTITLSGTGTHYFNGAGCTLEAVIFTGSATRLLVTSFSTLSLSGTAGTIRQEDGDPVGITVEATGVCTNMTLRDMWFNAANRINAKVNCTNLGNNKGIVFKDVARAA